MGLQACWRFLGWGGLALALAAGVHAQTEGAEPQAEPGLAAEVGAAAEVEDVPRPPQVLQQGRASYYSNRFHGRRTASGERYNRHAMTAAHPSLPFGSLVVVRSLRTGREVVVRITDRGPHLKNRIIDLSLAAAEALGIRRHGLSEVQLIDRPAVSP